MQKKLIALAIAAAFSAPAFADTTVYGLVDAAIVHASADGQKSDTIGLSSGLAGSRIGVKSAEDLDNGMKAIAVIEYKLDTQTSSGIGAARQQYLALAGDFGTFATGYLQTTGYDWQNKYDPTSGSDISPLGNLNKTGGFLIGNGAAAARASRALAYMSPKFNGFSFNVNYSTALNDALGNLTVASTAADTKTTAYLLSADYAAGPVAVGGVYAKTSTPGGTTDKKEYALGASYDFGMAKLFATYQSSTPTGLSANKATSVGATIPAGPGTVVVSYAKAKMDSLGSNMGASGETVGYLYSMSKTVTVYGAYSKESNDSATKAFSVDNGAFGGGNMTVGGGSNLLAIGLQKKF